MTTTGRKLRFWERWFGTGTASRSRREEKVRQYIIHRLSQGASLQEILDDEFVRRHSSRTEVEAIISDSEVIRSAREGMADSFGDAEGSGER